MTHNLPNPTIAVILAGGKARRFNGQDKGKIIIRNERLIDIVHNRLKPQTDDIIISGTHNYGLGLENIPDKDNAPGGPVGGLYSIWSEIQKCPKVEGFFTVAVDGPNLPDNLIASLYDKSSSAIAVDQAGRHPTYGWWRLDDLTLVWSQTVGQSSISLNKLADLIGAKPVAWEDKETFANINNQEDLIMFVKGA